MKKYLLNLLLLVNCLYCFSQETPYTTYSYQEFFDLIKNGTDSVFSLSNALIRLDKDRDQSHLMSNYNSDSPDFTRTDTITIDKILLLDNVQFIPGADGESGLAYPAFHHVRFRKLVRMNSTMSLFVTHCQFDQPLMINVENEAKRIAERLFELVNDSEGTVRLNHIGIFESHFGNGINVQVNPWQLRGERIFGEVFIVNSSFEIRDLAQTSNIWVRGLSSLSVWNNRFINTNVRIDALHNSRFNLSENEFQSTASIRMSAENSNQTYLIGGNEFKNRVLLSMDEIHIGSNIRWEDWTNRIVDRFSLQNYIRWLSQQSGYEHLAESRNIIIMFQDSLISKYRSEYIFQDEAAFKEETKLRAKFNEFYKRQFDNRSANLTYIEIKDLETGRMKYEYQQNPNFDNFFSLKINQFLKTFSVYGTRPAKAIVFSLYVILIFAFVYLFFPNSWDSHGKNRLINRYTFFMKYMRRDAGIHEVYLEEKKPELMAYEEFKTVIQESEKSVPRFFTATALPLYRWALSGSRLSSAFLRRVDVIQGSWDDVPKARRWWKQVLLIGAFSIAILYDLIIKMLNALMLSINTFTTLGFGEIPIRGLPRYLAIVQGFIGWFMLTIFSVSLISQLLN